MQYNTVLAIIFIAIATVASVAVYSNALSNQAAVQAGLQECVITFDYGVKTAWQKECPPVDKQK